MSMVIELRQRREQPLAHDGHVAPRDLAAGAVDGDPALAAGPVGLGVLRRRRARRWRRVQA